MNGIRAANHRLVLALILFGGAAVRLFRLGAQSLWNDEAVSAVIARGTVGQIAGNAFQSRHPPGYYLLLHFWRLLAGESDFALRLPSALIGAAAIAAIYLAGRTLFDRRTGLWAALITAVMPFHLFYSQEMRMYILVFLFTTLLVWAQSLIWQDDRPRNWAAYLLSALGGLYSHYFFVLIVGTLGLYFLLRRWRSGDGPAWRRFIFVHGAMGLLYSPILLIIGGQLSQPGGYWLESVSIGRLFSLPLAFTVGQFLSGGLIMAGFALVLVLLIFALLQSGRALLRREPEWANVALVLLACWLPVLIVYAVSFAWTPLTNTRLLIVATPGFYLLLAWSAGRPKERMVNMALIVLLLILGLVANYNWFTDEQYAKPAVRDAATFLAGQVETEEAVVHASDSGFRLMIRYQPALDHRIIVEHTDVLRIEPEVFELMGGRVTPESGPFTETFWLVLHQDFAIEEQEALYERFAGRYEELEAHNVAGVRLYRYRWEPPS